jgi:hypothetical protein
MEQAMLILELIDARRRLLGNERVDRAWEEQIMYREIASLDPDPPRDAYAMTHGGQNE